MERKVAKVGAVKTERNRSRSEPKVGVSCTCGLLVARGPGRGATSRIIPRRKEVAIPHAYPAPGKVRNRNYEDLPLKQLADHFDGVMSAAYSVSLFTDWQRGRVSEAWVKRRVGAEGGPAR